MKYLAYHRQKLRSNSDSICALCTMKSFRVLKKTKYILLIIIQIINRHKWSQNLILISACDRLNFSCLSGVWPRRQPIKKVHELSFRTVSHGDNRQEKNERKMTKRDIFYIALHILHILLAIGLGIIANKALMAEDVSSF